jgi:hypothetical protein
MLNGFGVLYWEFLKVRDRLKMRSAPKGRYYYVGFKEIGWENVEWIDLAPDTFGELL